MRIALCNEVIRELAFERQCEFARKVGYDGLEVAPFTLGDEPHVAAGIAPRASCGEPPSDAGIAITGLHYLMIAPKGLSHHLERRRPACPHRRGHAPAVRAGGRPRRARSWCTARRPSARLEPGRETEGRKWGAECFAAVAEAATKAGVVYCIEPLAGPDANFINTVEEAAAIVRAVDNPALRTMVDCAAAGRAEAQPIPDLLRQWLPTGLIGHVHLNDPNRRGPGEGELAVRADPAGAVRRRLFRHGCGRAVRLRARRPQLCRARHRLRARRDADAGVRDLA